MISWLSHNQPPRLQLTPESGAFNEGMPELWAWRVSGATPSMLVAAMFKQKHFPA